MNHRDLHHPPPHHQLHQLDPQIPVNISVDSLHLVGATDLSGSSDALSEEVNTEYNSQPAGHDVIHSNTVTQ